MATMRSNLGHLTECDSLRGPQTKCTTRTRAVDRASHREHREKEVRLVLATKERIRVTAGNDSKRPGLFSPDPGKASPGGTCGTPQAHAQYGPSHADQPQRRSLPQIFSGSLLPPS